MGKEVCCVVYDRDCLAPADVEQCLLPNRIGECFACGEPVCSKCSKILKYHSFGKRRICFNCISDQLNCDVYLNYIGV